MQRTLEKSQKKESSSLLLPLKEKERISSPFSKNKSGSVTGKRKQNFPQKFKFQMFFSKGLIGRKNYLIL